MKRLLFLFTLILVSCNNDEETRIFTVTTNAIPYKGGTVTLETTLETTGEYNLGDIANIKATPSAGYVFEKFSSNATVGGYVAGGWQGGAQTPLFTSIEMRCYESVYCSEEIIVNGHFAKED
tara:strand:+ start:6933 stop:7298 length:366 start_codon:yes stop_codon:yes gene_type:complete